MCESNLLDEAQFLKPVVLTLLQDLDSLRMEQISLTQQIRQLNGSGMSSSNSTSGLPPRGDDSDGNRRYNRGVRRYRNEDRKRADRGWLCGLHYLTE